MTIALVCLQRAHNIQGENKKGQKRRRSMLQPGRGPGRMPQGRRGTGGRLAACWLMEPSTRRPVPHRTRKKRHSYKEVAFNWKDIRNGCTEEAAFETDWRQAAFGRQRWVWVDEIPSNRTSKSKAPKRETAVCSGTVRNPVKSDCGIYVKKSTYCG